MVKLVGILNITPDSFSDGGLFTNPKQVVKHAKKLFAQGASLIDIGAESTRPGATPLSDEEEWERLEPVLKELLKLYPGRISLDSYHPENIKKAFKLGPVIVNDVTGMNNPKMIDAVSKLRPTVIISHLPGDDIQRAHKLTPVKSVEQVRDDLLSRATLLQKRGLKKKQIILDPGIGFGKTSEVNSGLLHFAELVPGYLVMIGYSRKRFLGEKRMEIAPNIKAGRIAIENGAQYLRVHDVLAHKVLVS